jgi:ribonuclease-3
MDISNIESLIGYEFSDKQILITAFTHSSYSNEQKVQSNEMLEFLGDSILSLVVSEFLYQNAKADWNEKNLSEKRASIVNKTALARAVDELKIIDFLLCGVGETRSNPVKSEATKCDLFEAVTGAVFLDGGIDEARDFIFRSIGANMVHVLKNKTDNYVGMLLEHTLKQKKDIFKYSEITENNDNFFLVEVVLDEKVLSKAKARSKSEAERLAAKTACSKLALI